MPARCPASFSGRLRLAEPACSRSLKRSSISRPCLCAASHRVDEWRPALRAFSWGHRGSAEPRAGREDKEGLDKGDDDVPVGDIQGMDHLIKSIDPFRFLSTELSRLKLDLVDLIGTDQARLNRVASYYFSSTKSGKMLRPLIVLLVSQATSGSRLKTTDSRSIDLAYSPTTILNDPFVPPTRFAHLAANHHEKDPSILPGIAPPSSACLLPSQVRVAEIAEMIHVASLLHDDVIDQSDQRRGQTSSPVQFGNKLSILAGDFLLSRSSLLLSRIGNNQVTELIASAIANLVQGEFIQFDQSSGTDQGSGKSLMDEYIEKTYLKTAALIAKTARSAVILSHDPDLHRGLIESIYEFAKNLGLAFQIVDDILDYTGSNEVMGKPTNGSDLKLGLITAPTLYAWEEHSELGELISRRFKREGDIELVQSIVKSSEAIPRSYQLAQAFIDRSKAELFRSVPPSESRSALENLCDLVLKRVN